MGAGEGVGIGKFRGGAVGNRFGWGGGNEGRFKSGGFLEGDTRFEFGVGSRARRKLEVSGLGLNGGGGGDDGGGGA